MVRMRYYDPNLGRWTQRDGMTLTGQHLRDQSASVTIDWLTSAVPCRAKRRAANTLADALASATSFGNCDTAVIRRPSRTGPDAQFVFRFWSGARDLNPGPHGPEFCDLSSKKH